MTYPVLWRARRGPLWNEFPGFPRDVDSIFARFFNAGGAHRLATWSPLVDVHEDESGIHVSTELPGLSRDDVQVTVEDGVLLISGEKKLETEEGEKDSGYHVMERRYGRFERSFTLPRGVDATKVSAKFENGVLNIDLPKSDQAKPKQIPVK
ncbi:MAG: Hsp20/alpha crystallin family protein [Gemmatimonadales bacterium]|jgi:HSP20 family protein